jgi:hypothetical protein
MIEGPNNLLIDNLSVLSRDCILSNATSTAPITNSYSIRSVSECSVQRLSSTMVAVVMFFVDNKVCISPSLATYSSLVVYNQQCPPGKYQCHTSIPAARSRTPPHCSNSSGPQSHSQTLYFERTLAPICPTFRLIHAQRVHRWRRLSRGGPGGGVRGFRD